MMKEEKLTCLVLAAGRGTRMQSSLPKPLHPVANRPMVHYPLRAAEALHPAQITVVIGPNMEALAEAVKPYPTALQAEAKGTGHAVQCGLNGVAPPQGDVLVIYGDTPLVTTETLEKLITRRRAEDHPAVVVSAMTPPSPTGYGRLVTEGDHLLEIVEEKDASEEQRRIRLCNGGILLFDGKLLPDLLAGLSNNNAKGEYYLTDTVTRARQLGHVCACVAIPYEDVMGVNTPEELAVVDGIMQRRLREAAEGAA